VPREKRLRRKNWWKDPSVAKIKSGGGPPPNHPRRCQAPNFFGDQCGRWALTGVDYCSRHGGRNPRAKKQLANYYSKHAGTKLSTLLKEIAEQSDDERLSLTEEIDVARINAARVLLLFEKIVIEENFTDKDGRPLDISPEKMLKLKSSCAVAVRDSLDQVSALVQAMAKVEVLKRDKISVHNIKWAVDRIMRLIEEEVTPMNSECAKRLCERIANMKLLESDSSNPNVVLSIS